MTTLDQAPLNQLDRSPSLTRAAVIEIVRAIVDGRYAPGERLVETRVAASLGISRSPVREALKALESEGLIRIEQGRGTFVREVPPVDVEHMIPLRATLEALAARLFIHRGAAAPVAELAEINRAMNEAVAAGDQRRWRELDWRFHETICRGSGNDFLIQAWRNIHNLLRLYMIHINPAYEKSSASVVRNHDAYVAALQAGDADGAAALLCSTIMETGFRALGKPVPPALQGLVTVDA